MDRLKDKIVLITGAAGSIGKAVAEAVERGGRHRHHQRSRRAQGAAHALDVASEPDWLRVIAEIGTHPRPARWPGQCRRSRRARQYRGDRLRHLAEDPGGQSRRHVPRLQARLPLLKQRGGSIVNLSSVAGLIGGHNFAAYNASKGGVRLSQQIGRAAWRAAQSAGALQFGPSGLPRRPDGRRDAAADQLPRRRARAHHPRHSARPARHARPRSPTCASICCPTNPASSPAPSSSSTAV